MTAVITFIKDVDIADDRPVCWAKIPTILKAFEDHEPRLCRRAAKPPQFYKTSDMFVHVYSCYARHYIPLDRCETVLQR